MAIYSKLLARHLYIPSGTTTVYTVPVGKTVIIRDIALTQSSGGAGAIGVLVGTSGADQVWLVLWQGVPSYVSQHWTGRCVLSAGDSIVVYSATGTVGYTISGYELTP